MWSRFKVNDNTGDLDQISAPTPDIGSMADDQATDDTFILWTGDWPKDEREQHEIAEELIRANNGHVLRVTLGMTFTSEKNSAGACGGRCFCVIDSDGSRCEGKYQRLGHVIWTRCPGDC